MRHRHENERGRAWRSFSGRRLWAVIFAIVAIVVMTTVPFGAVVGSASTPRNDGVRGVVLFVGDSNITLSAASVDWTLTWLSHADNGYVPVLASRVGASIRNQDCLIATGCKTTNYWKAKLAGILSRVNPNAIVSDLGVIDTNHRGTSTTSGYSHYGHKIDWFMSLVPRAKPVIWTNLPCAIEPQNRVAGCHAVNHALAAATQRWANLWVLDWARVANPHPAYMTSPGTDVHLSTAGTAAWAKLVVGFLDAKFPPP
jgi:hypothetical protein